MTERIVGTIKNIVAERGFGFIDVPDGRWAYFFHLSDCESASAFYALETGDPVTFEPVTPAPKGPRAMLVRVPESA